MMASTTPLSYAAGERLFAEGDAGDTMFIIKRGHAQVSFTHPDGRVEVISQRAAGECCGETSCLLRKPRNVTVTCVSGAGCEALRVSRADFLALMRGSWDVAHDLVAVSGEAPEGEGAARQVHPYAERGGRRRRRPLSES